MIAGEYSTAITNRFTMAQHWNGSTWAVSTPRSLGSFDFLRGVSCRSDRFCLAAGQFNNPRQGTLAETWDGAAWTTRGTVIPPFSVTTDGAYWGASCASETMCVAVGVTSAGNTLASVWNGLVLSIQSTPSPGSSHRLLRASCPTMTFCMTVGQNSVAGSQRPLALVGT